MNSPRGNTAARSPLAALIPNPKLRLRDQLREVMRFGHYAIRTEETYWQWIRRFILFHGKRHPREMGTTEVHAFLTHLAVEGQVAVATRNQALNALVFLYAQVLRQPLGQLEEFARPQRPARLPVVLTQEEARRLWPAVPVNQALLVRLLYGTGLRVMEGMRLRVKDVATTQIYTHVMAKPGLGVRSPLDGP